MTIVGLGQGVIRSTMQLEFHWRDAQALQRDLSRRMGRSIDIVITDNSSSIMSYKPPRNGQAPVLRLHHMFLMADSQVIASLARWLQSRRRRVDGTIVDSFIREHRHLIRKRAAACSVRLRTRGSVHDLRKIYDSVNHEHFDGDVDAPITWGRMPGKSRRRSIRFGSYTPEDHLIRVHPLLDQDFVPAYFVRYIVFHEMLHAYVGIERSPSGRRQIHSRRFKELEEAYPDFERANAWYEDPRNLSRLLRTPKRPAA